MTKAAAYSRRGKTKGKARGRSWYFNSIPLLVALIVLALLGYLVLSVHGPIMIHLW